MTVQTPQEQHDIYDLGLQADLNMWTRKPIERRRILQLGAVGIGVLLAGSGVGAVAARAATPAELAALACVDEIPQETQGPYPADGSNQNLNILTRSGIVRQDIRTSLGTGTVAEGIPLTFDLTLISTEGDCAPLAGYAVYAWHCDRDGNYSLYSNGVTDEDYLRGVQVSDSNGKLSFTSIFPACYSGRWPHIHFEIYESLGTATAGSNALHTSQLAFPEEVCDVVYATAGYEQSIRNLAGVTLASDNVFSDGAELQMATLTGDIASGYHATLSVGVNPEGTSNPGGGGAPGGGAPPSGMPLPSGGPRPSGMPAPSGMPMPSGMPLPTAAPSAAPSASASPSPVPGLPNTGGGGTNDGPSPWAIAAPLAALAAIAAPIVRRLRRG